MIHLPRVFLNSLLAVLFLLLYGCLQVPAPAAMDTPAPTATATIPPLTLSGPETTPIAPRPYPSTLTVETAQQGISAVVDAPSTITGLADVQAIMTKHTQLARDAGLSFDHMAVKYVASEQRWFLVPVDSGGKTIAGWLEIADPTSLSGWRFAEQPTWDSQYHPSTDTYQYGLPALHNAANHFEVGFANGFPILIEVTPSGTPQYWNNIAQKTTLLVEGAVLPTETPTPESTSEIVPAYTETITEEIDGVPVTVELVTDHSLPEYQFLPINKIFINPAFGENQYGETASQAMERVVAEGLFLAWQKNGTDEQVAQRQNVSFDTYMKMWGESISGQRPWEDVEISVYANDLATPDYDPKYMTIRPGPVKIVFINANTTSNMTKDILPSRYRHDTNQAMAFGTQYNNGSLEVWVGFPYSLGGYIRMGQIFTPTVTVAIHRLSWSVGDQGSIIQDETAEVSGSWQWKRVSIDLGNNCFKAIMAFDPSDDPWNNK